MRAPPDGLTAALADRYRVERELGAGGMATVYLARDLKHDRDVAIKVLHPDLASALGAERFLTEIRTTARLQHPHILPLLDSGEAAGLLYYVMPYVSGETLRARLVRERQLSVDDAVRIAREVADALGHAHAHGIIHRDIKPENILLQEGHALVADFGIALAVQSAAGPRLTQTGLSLGTPQYMSPEQAMGEKALDARADLYALGAVTYEMLTGEPPFTGATVQAIVAKVLSDRPTPPSMVRDTVPPHVEAAVLKALAKLPADRFRNTSDFSSAMSDEHHSLSRSDAARTASPDDRRTRIRPRARALWPAAAVGAIGIGGAVWMATRPAPDRPVVRFEVSLSYGVTHFGALAQQLAISNDGRRIAFFGKRGDSVDLYVRSLDDPVPRRVMAGLLDPGTREATLSFSPDGESIVFSSASGLHRIPSNGGQPKLLTRSGSAGQWTDRGQLLFTADRSLWIADEEGDAARVIVRPDSTAGIFALRRPVALPGGQYALVILDRSRSMARADSLRLGVVSLETGTVEELPLSATFARFAAPGHVLLTTETRSLRAVPFSLRTRRIVGPPVALMEDVIDFAVPPSGGPLVYLSPGDERTDPRALIVDRVGRERRVGWNSPEGDVFPRISPDGRTIVAAGDGTLTEGFLFIDIATGARQLGAAHGEGGRPEWARDGRAVYFIRAREGAHELVERRLDRATPDRVLFRDSTSRLYEITAGPRAGWGALRFGAPEVDIFIAPMDSLGAPRPFAARPGVVERNPALSPDGRLVAYVSDESGRDEIYVQPIAGTGRRIAVSVAGGIEPVWSREWAVLFYRDPTHIVAATIDPSGSHVVRRDRLFADRYHRSNSISDQNWDVFPGAREFFFTPSRAGDRSAFVLLDWRDALAPSSGTAGRSLVSPSR